ncbi:hypothetical protein EW146_g1606 [Bondarzewia mesenterica]|uniref:Sey1/RHD3-like three-helix bundle domain-containing protein n=1 Tax=Bondarzewia mesenterica TaxID=1095465 RepID=A0A4V3XG07_9AGAM|nr:hypothetical protein EW146_g1606 [Bondarzewia mesenterica]
MRVDGYNFAEVVGKAPAHCEIHFTKDAKEAVVSDEDAAWSWVQELGLLEEELRRVSDQLRKDETKKIVNAIEISEPVDLLLNKASPDMWDSIRRTFKETLDKAETSYLTKAKDFDCTVEENEVALASLRKCAWIALRAKIDKQTVDNVLLGKLRAYFEERFRCDDAGVPRVWKPEDDIDGDFKEAKDQTLDVIPLDSRISPNDTSLESAITLSTRLSVASVLTPAGRCQMPPDAVPVGRPANQVGVDEARSEGKEGRGSDVLVPRERKKGKGRGDDEVMSSSPDNGRNERKQGPRK